MNYQELLQRRVFIQKNAYGLGAMALMQLEQQAAAKVSSLNHTPKVKRIIHLCMAGGPSQFETFDPKPKLRELNGKDFPESFTKGQQLAQLQNQKLIARGSFVDFKKYGQSGQEISSLLPKIAGISDDICIIRSMVTEQINHDPAQAFMNSGSILKGRPSMGSWLLYGLGSDTQNLPGFIVLTSSAKGYGGAQPVSSRQWSSGFLPSKYQGIFLQSKGDPVHYINNPQGISVEEQWSTIQSISAMNRLQVNQRQQLIDFELSTRMAQYELAYKMQTSVPELTDIKSESQKTLDLYGIKEIGDGSFASNCLMARRLAERGVRFIQLYHRAWDHHNNIEKDMPRAALDTDQASAALISDLKQRGLLEDTLVIWGGEFGRTPMGQGTGRDHHINSFSLFLAGGGTKPGFCYGNTDELGYRSIENKVTFHDLHATILHLAGIQYQQFSAKFQGLDVRLTGVDPARIIKEILV
jgi:hypothetical protein